MIIGTAGHIDHGKTSLVRALTGVDTDRLPEEKSRGITLDLGFAYVPLADGSVLGFVDVPGHERLVHTMIAGAASIGMALLVVAADDGVMPQTREHLQVLSLLGVSRGVVALTKTDLADDDRILDVELEIAALLEGTPLAGAPVFPVSVVTGAGIEALRTALLTTATRAAHPVPDGRRFRLSVDRSFSLAGAGTIVTGSVVSGRVAVGESVLVLPSGLRARVRGIHAANQAVQAAGLGERCALNLVGSGIHKDGISRGDWIVDPDGATTTRRCDATVDLLSAERGALRSGTPVLLHHGAGQASARAVLLDPAPLPPGAAGLVHLALDRALPLRHGDRFVLRDISASRTMAGGRVLDPRPPERHRRSAVRLEALRSMVTDDARAALLGRFDRPPFLLAHDSVLADWGLMDRPADLIRMGAFLTTQAGLDGLTRQFVDTLTAFHTAQPAAPGMPPSALRLALPTRPSREAFAALVTCLQERGTIAAEAHLVRMPEHEAGLTGAEAQAWDQLRPMLADAPFRPPLLHELAVALGQPDPPLRRTCKGLARLGLIVEVAPDRFFLRQAVLDMAAAAHDLAAGVGDNGFTAAQFRDRLGNGRQLAIQILDYFDRRGVTVRRGDLRRAGKPLALPGA